MADSKFETWQFDLVRAIGGVAILRIRRGLKSPWMSPKQIEKLPDNIKQYLCLKATNNVTYIEGVSTIEDLKDEDVKWTKHRKAKSYGWLYSVRGTLKLAIPQHVLDQRKRVDRYKNSKTAIRNIRQLADHVGAGYDKKDADIEVASRVARRLYKDTDCGICFGHTGYSVSVSGYCEGIDAECRSHSLNFPFSQKEFDELVQTADDDGNTMWNETHGCEKCGPENEYGYRDVNPNCEECGGFGGVI